MAPQTLAPARPLTSLQVCDTAGISYRVLDYWCRLRVLIPAYAAAHGSGTRRLFSARDAAVAQVLGCLTQLGADTNVLREVASFLSDWPDEHWTGHLLIDSAGQVWRPGDVTPRDAGWFVDLSRLSNSDQRD